MIIFCTQLKITLKKRKNFMKRFLFFTSALLLFLFGIPTISMATDSIQLVVNDSPLKSDVSPQLMNGRTLVPLRVISEAMGMDVQWNSDSQKIDITKNQTQLELTINNQNAVENGTSVKVDQPPILYQDRTLVPLRFIGEAMGATVNWDQTSETVRVDVTSTSTTTATLHLLDILQQDNGITLDTDGTISPKAFTLDSPNRIVIDLPSTLLSDQLDGKLSYASGSGILPLSGVSQSNSLIQQIRVSQFSSSPPITRVVMELSQSCPFTVNPNGNQVSVVLDSGQVNASNTSNVNNISNVSSADVIPPATKQPDHSKYVIVIDAGHGGKDTGAIGIQGNYEKDFTLPVAKLLVQELNQHPEFQVLMTRSADTYPTLQDRVDLANQSNANLFLSIHGNSFDPDTRGTEVFYTNDNSKDFASTIHKHLLEATGFPDRGIKTNNLFVTSRTNMPATLIEVGFLTNSIEDAEMLKSEFQQRVAKNVADAIYEYYTQNH
jgi:N-acetylmuramoyl-L-alanine amidase